jgi:hypothetical protein
MDDYPSNAHSDKEAKTTAAKTAPAKKREPVVKGPVVKRKIPLGKRLRQSFLSGEGLRGIWGHVTGEVLIPAAKDAAYDALRLGGERAIFGDSMRRPDPRRGGSPTSYTGYYRPAGKPSHASPPAQQQREISARGRSTHDFGEIVLESRGEAEVVLDTLYDIVNEYSQATLADLYELVNISSSYTDQKYGWTTLQGSNIQHVRGGGWLINLPKPVPID